MENRKLENRIADIVRQSVRILNATVGKPYEARLDVKKLHWTDLASFYFDNLEETGLSYDEKTGQITGVPVQSGDLTLTLKFKLTGEPSEAAYHEKKISFIVNPDPKTLWKNLESNRDDPYWKEDDATVLAPLLADRHLLVSSKRGRSHANTGSFREDDFAFKTFDTGWNLVVVADGAGSAKLSRKGSALACNAVIEYFSLEAAEEPDTLYELLQLHKSNSGDDTQKKLTHYVYNKLGKAALYAHKQLEQFATGASVALKDLNTTLIFTLFKKWEDLGWAFLSFGVGDCPIAVLNENVSEVFLMNWLDVGEFGGGTRFITMPEIFQHEKFASRFGCKLMDDFSYLIMMTDGIYDAKFVVESNLADLKNWKEFLADLQGKNEEGIALSFNATDTDMVPRFSAWMDFWSPGNHDDRTLALVFKSGA